MFSAWLEKIDRTVVAAVAAVIAVIVWWMDRGFVATSAAMFALIIASPVLYRRVKEPLADRYRQLPERVREAVVEYAPYAAVTIATLIALGPVTLGEMPVSQDHANHYFATHLLVRELLPSGRFFGWTDALGTGYPFGDTYHTPAYLLTGFLYLISFGAVSLKTSYAFGIVLAWLIPVIAVTAWSRRIAGPFGATLAGIAFALDMGSDREGGWIYAMFHGVWTQHVGAGIWVLALLALFRLTEKPDTRRLSVAALTAGVSMWIHPMNSVTLLIGGLLLFVVHYLMTARDAGDEGKAAALLVLIPALFAAGVIGLVWVIRMMTAGDVVFAYVAYWQPLEILVKHLFEGHFMDHQLALVSVFGLVGLLRLAVAGGRFRIYTIVLPAVLILLGSMVLILESDVGLAGGSLGIMQYRRFSVAAKPFWFAMSGVGISAIGGVLKQTLAARVPATPPLRVLLAALLAPFLAAGLTAAPDILRSPVAMPLTLARTGDAVNLTHLRKALEVEAEKCPDGLCRAVYVEKPGHGGLYPVIDMADAGFAWQPTLSLPANNFKWINSTKDFDLMAARGVSVVVSKWPEKHPRLEEIGVFGRHHLYRIKGAKAARAAVEGTGKARVISWTPEERVIRISGAKAGAGLVVYQPPYRKWRAEQSGKSLEIVKHIDKGQVYSLVENVRDGEVTLTYHDTMAENIATVLGFLLVGLCVVGTVVRPRALPLVIRGAALRRTVHVCGIAASSLLVLTPLGMRLGGRVAERVEWLAGEPAGTVLKEVLHQRNPDDLQFSPERYCVPAYVRNPAFGCNERDLLPYLAAGAKRRGKIPSCLDVGIPPKGTTAITYELPNGTTHLKGRIHQRQGGSITGRADSQSLGKASRDGRAFEIAVESNQKEITIDLSASKASHACLELVAVERPASREVSP